MCIWYEKCIECKYHISEEFTPYVTYQNEYSFRWSGFEIKCPKCGENFWVWIYEDIETEYCVLGIFSGPYGENL